MIFPGVLMMIADITRRHVLPNLRWAPAQPGIIATAALRAVLVCIALSSVSGAMAGQSPAQHASDPPVAAAIRDCDTCPELVLIPAGEFLMGADIAQPRKLGLPEFWATREQPVTHVTIERAFYLGRYEVSRGEFARFAAATGYSPAPGCWHFVGSEWLFDETRNWQDAGIDQNDEHPVTCINWLDAQAYLTWLSATTGKAYRLASEAEWEYAVRAGTQTVYWFGDDPARICEFVNLGDITTRERFGWDETEIKYEMMDNWKGEDCRDGYAAMAPVYETAANPFGLHGMLGNANEWVADCWNDDHSEASGDQAARLIGADCGLRVMRGQGWTAIAASTRPAFRLKMNATDRRFTFGFRVARD
jgi:formylglycine-generating enzyme required for sulfatase activity